MIRPRIQHGDTVLDATAGNGHDTIFLAEAVGESGRVIAIDCNPDAIASTATRSNQQALADRISLIQNDHIHLSEILADQNATSLAAAVFNLGYLPGSDKSLTTTSSSTIPALRQALDHIQLGGILVIVCYPGHDAGAIESEAVKNWAEGLDEKHYLTINYGSLNQHKRPPFIIAVERRR